MTSMCANAVTSMCANATTRMCAYATNRAKIMCYDEGGGFICQVLKLNICILKVTTVNDKFS